jgi:hypothetical protein
VAILHRADTPRTEAFAVTQGFNVIDDGFLAVTGAQEVAVERMDDAFFWHGLFCRIQRLSNDLPAKHLA